MWNVKRITIGRIRAEVKGMYGHLHIIYSPPFTLSALQSICMVIKIFRRQREKKVAPKRKTVITDRTFSINKPWGLLDTLGRGLQ